MIVKLKCDLCGAIITGNNELDAKINLTDHVCEVMRDLSELPMDLLRKVIKDEISEEEAWAIMEDEKGVRSNGL